MRVRRPPLGAIAGYIAAVALVAVFLDHVSWQGIALGLRSARWPLVAAAVAVRLASFGVSALRWQMLLAPAGSVPLRGVLAVTMMGAAATAVAPLQTAEIIRPYLLSRRQGIELSAALATAAAEWLLDTAALMALFLPALALQHASTYDAGVWLTLTPVVCFAAAVAGIAFLPVAPQWIERLLQSERWRVPLSAQRRSQILNRARSFAIGLRTLQRPAGLVGVAVYSLLFFALTAIASWLTLKAFDMPVSLAAGFLVLGLVTLAGMVPTPGAVGGFHAVCQIGLATFFGVARADTVLPVIALYAVLTLPPAILGAAWFLAAPLPSMRL